MNAAPELDSEHLLTWLRERLSNRELEFVEAPRRLLGGRETEIVRFRLRRGGPDWGDPLVLRAIPHHYDPARARWEAVVQNAVAGQGLPAPRVHLVEEDPGVLGFAFLVMECMPGIPMTGALAAEVDGAADRSLWSWLRFLAKTTATAARVLPGWVRRLTALQLRLHALDTGPVRREIESHGLARIASVDGRIDEYEQRTQRWAMSGLRSGVAWLRANRPPDTELVIGHGDFLPVNVLERDGETTAILDWSFAKLAEPAYDVAATLFIFHAVAAGFPSLARPPVAVFARRLARLYTDTYGASRALDPERLRYFEALRHLNEITGVAQHRARARLAPQSANAQENFVKGYCRRFEALTGVTLELPAEVPA